MPDTITISAGRPARDGGEKDFAGPDGTYEMTLVTVSEPTTEKSSIELKRGDGTWTFRDWTFAVSDGGEYDGQVLDLRANAKSTGPKSKQFEIIVALFGRTPPVGTEIDVQRHLVGRSCLCRIATRDGTDFPYVAGLVPLPAISSPAPAARGRAAEPEPGPVAVTAAAGTADDELPFDR